VFDGVLGGALFAFFGARASDVDFTIVKGFHKWGIFPLVSV
jgi:hypothetical protein